MSIETFGGLAIRLDGRVLSGFASRKAEALFVYLAAAGQAVPRSVLASLFWEDSSETRAATNLRVALSSLKKQLEPFLEIDRQSVRFRPSDRTRLDALLLERNLADEDLEAGLALYRGDFLEGFHLRNCRAFEDWQSVTREHYHLRIKESLHDSINLCLARGTLKIGLRYVRRLLELDPFDEVALRRLLELLARTGQRNTAVQQFERYQKIYADELGVEPDPATLDLYDRIRNGVIQPDSSVRLPEEISMQVASRSSVSNLPQPLTPFVGRKAELSRLEDLLSEPDVRLLTIFGPGGIGKTRLSQESGRRENERYQDGVFFVSLFSISDPEAMLSAIASAVGFQAVERGDLKNQLLDYLARRNMLLILDNFETVLTGAPVIVEILQRAPGIKAITTSREKLNLIGEHVFRLGGLNYESGENEPEDALRDSALLFLGTARRLNPEIHADPSAHAIIAQICRLVEGMPLAIELAASWTDTLTLDEIRGRIETGLDILDATLGDLPERHRNIRLVFDATFQSLDPPTQRCFSTLSVFRGSFNADAAKVIADASIRQLKTLVRKSLLTPQDKGRYQLHELLRQYGEEKLGASPEQEALVKRRHSEYYRDMLVAAEKQLIGGRIAARERASYAAEIRNIRGGFRRAVEAGDTGMILGFLPGLYALDPASSRIALLSWAIEKLGEGHPTAGEELVIGHLLCRTGLDKFHNGFHEEGRAEVCRGHAILQKAGAAATALLHKANLAAANIHAFGINFDYSPLIQAALAYFRPDYDVRFALEDAGIYDRKRGDMESAETYLRELIDLAEPLYERSWLASAHFGLGLVAEVQGRYIDAIDHMHKSVLLYAELDSLQMVGVLHKHLGLLHAALNRHLTAREHYHHALALFEEIGVQWRIVEGHMNLGETALLMGSLEEAQKHYARAQEIYRHLKEGSVIEGYLIGELGWLATVKQDYPGAIAHFLSVLPGNREPYPEHIIPAVMARSILLLETHGETALAEKIAAFILSDQFHTQLNTKRAALQRMDQIKAERGGEAHAALVDQARRIKLADLQTEWTTLLFDLKAAEDQAG